MGEYGERGRGKKMGKMGIYIMSILCCVKLLLGKEGRELQGSCACSEFCLSSFVTIAGHCRLEETLSLGFL